MSTTQQYRAWWVAFCERLDALVAEEPPYQTPISNECLRCHRKVGLVYAKDGHTETQVCLPCAEHMSRV